MFSYEFKKVLKKSIGNTWKKLVTKKHSPKNKYKLQKSLERGRRLLDN